MIIAAIGIIIILMMSLGILLAYDNARNDVAKTTEASAIRQHERMTESVDVTMAGGVVTIDNEWGEETNVRGVMVRCPNGGPVFTANLTASVGGAQIQAVNITDTLDRLRGSCPP